MMPEYVQAVVTSLRSAIGVSVATAFAGFSKLLEWLPNDIGWYATALGMLSTTVLLWIQFRRDRREQKAFDIWKKLEKRRRG